MSENRDFIFLLKISFFIYAIFFWIQIIFLGRKLMVLETPGQAVHLMQSTNLFLVKVVQAFISNKKDWYFAIFPIIKEVSIPYLILLLLWYRLNDSQIFKLLSMTILLPFCILIGILFSLNQKTLTAGLNVAHILGISSLVVSIGLSLITLFIFLKKKGQMESND